MTKYELSRAAPFPTFETSYGYLVAFSDTLYLYNANVLGLDVSEGDRRI